MSRSNKSSRESKRYSAFWIAIVGIVFIGLLGLGQYSGLYNIQFQKLPFFDSPKIQLVDISLDSGLGSFKRAPIYAANPSYIEVMGGGVAVADMDNDGWEDIFFTGMPSFDPEFSEPYSQSALYRNLGNETFEDITAKAGLNSIKGYPMGALFFDFDNNGTQDLYIAAYEGGQLFKNSGGIFSDITESAGVSLEGLCAPLPCLAAAASAGDYNRDGYLDLLVVNNAAWDINNPAHFGDGALIPAAYNGQPSVLFRNNGDGTFTNVTQEAGITNQDQAGYREDGKGLSAIWSDFNNDGWPDIYIANDMSPNRLYLNSGEGTFLEIGKAGFVDELKSSMGIDAADFNHDGHMDLVVTNLTLQMTSLFRNYGNLRFDYATFYTGIIPSARSSGWGIAFVDLDLDGHLDLSMASGPIWDQHDEAENLFFKNLGNGKFEDVTKTVASFSNDKLTRGLAVIDMDRSGTPDLIFSNIDGASPQLLKNKTAGNNWVRIDLEGTVSNRDAIGARVTIEREDGLNQSQIVVAGNSYLSTGSKSLFFGLGSSAIKQLSIQWPSGRTDTLTDENINMNEIIHIREGDNPNSPVEVAHYKP
ncbi:CRTAC1 family protein [Aliifodinibius sp. S!AR15-10]|uniref:CRTAC1 family protein n=1 Tax=Aliifodinibius sp. S!AR15-10 TaxID=2950437 RepID=UPI002860EF96|nr:CRTAC1 family protein [Aliifodinibius sp. S!AR15-10]MDR8392547.1 CRTAC1 family protein [Aliifodinibius sp. S!AR15-10]